MSHMQKFTLNIFHRKLRELKVFIIAVVYTVFKGE